MPARVTVVVPTTMGSGARGRAVGALCRVCARTDREPCRRHRRAATALRQIRASGPSPACHGARRAPHRAPLWRVHRADLLFAQSIVPEGWRPRCLVADRCAVGLHRPGAPTCTTSRARRWAAGSSRTRCGTGRRRRGRPPARHDRSRLCERRAPDHASARRPSTSSGSWPGDRSMARRALGLDPDAPSSPTSVRLVPGKGLETLLDATAAVSDAQLVRPAPGRSRASSRRGHTDSASRSGCASWARSPHDAVPRWRASGRRACAAERGGRVSETASARRSPRASRGRDACRRSPACQSRPTSAARAGRRRPWARGGAGGRACGPLGRGAHPQSVGRHDMTENARATWHFSSAHAPATRRSDDGARDACAAVVRRIKRREPAVGARAGLPATGAIAHARTARAEVEKSARAPRSARHPGRCLRRETT